MGVQSQIPSQQNGAVLQCRMILSNRASRVAKGQTHCTYPANETGYCKLHANGRAKAGQRDSTLTTPALTKAVLARYGRTRLEVSPVNALLSLIYEAAGNVEFLREKVNELQSMVLPGKTTREEVAMYVQLYDQERDRLHKYSSDAMRIGLEQRQVKLYELQARTIAQIIRSIVDELDLTPEQKVKAFSTAASELRTFAKKGDTLWSGPYQRSQAATVVDANSTNHGNGRAA